MTAATASSLEVRPRSDLAVPLRPPLLAGGPRSVADLEAAAAATPGGAVRLYRALHAYADAGVITFATGGGSECIAELRPMAPGFRLAPIPGGRVALSRFAHVRRDGAELILETPLGVGTVALRGEAVACLDELARGVEVASLLARSEHPGEIHALIELLVSNLAASPVRETGEAQLDDAPALAQWEFHDLLFHWRSRAGWHDGELGGTYRFAGRIAPTPSIAPQLRPAIPLPRPAAPFPPDAGLDHVLDARRSVREQGRVPMSVADLGLFLFHSARVREIVPGPEPLGPTTRRPYPSAGASYELELYLVVDRCAGLESGFYRYDAVAHGVIPISAPNADTEALLAAAATACGSGTRPQVLLAISARFSRVSWKYAGIAYALTLKNVGALYATMYLVATAIGLAPCALGVGDSRRFTRLAGVEPHAEVAVGEFMLGSRA